MKVSAMLQVADVEASSQWYQQLLGLNSGHGGAEYEMLFAGTPHESPLALQLHRWDAHEHGYLGTPEADIGNGVSLWFEVADKGALDGVWARVEATGVTVVEAPHWNPLAHHHELAIHDPDGYLLLVCTPFEMDGGETA